MTGNLKETIKNSLKEAMKRKEEKKLSVLRMLSAAISNEEIKTGKRENGLSDDEILKVIKSESKKRKDSIEAYEKAGRDDLAGEEKEELSVLSEYLPPEMTNEEIEKAAKEAVKETEAESMKDFGKAMKSAMEKTKGQADGNRVSEAVRKFLS